MSTFTVDMQGLAETQRGLDELQAALARPSSGKLRATSTALTGELAGMLRAAAASSGVPVAARVAKSIKPASRGSWPAVQVGGAVPVGRYGAIAAKLLWGSERGPAGDPNRFAVEPNAAGYWIAPTVRLFKDGPGMRAFTAAVDALISSAGFK